MTLSCSFKLPIVLVLIGLSLHLQLVASDHHAATVPFLFMLSSQNYSNDSSGMIAEQVTTGVQPAVDMAQESINDSPYVLSNYELSYDDNAVNSMVGFVCICTLLCFSMLIKLLLSINMFVSVLLLCVVYRYYIYNMFSHVYMYTFCMFVHYTCNVLTYYVYVGICTCMCVLQFIDYLQ